MKEKTTLVFTGDIGFDRYMTGKWDDEELLSAEITDFCRSADHVVANVEGAVIDPAELGAGGIFFHVMNPNAVKVFRRIGADIWNINNNHIMDGEDAGIVSTLRIAEAEGVRTVGAGLDTERASAPVFLDEAGGIGIVSVGYQPDCKASGKASAGCFSWNDRELIAKRISEIKKTCRWCIVVSHGGEEFCNMPLPPIRKKYLEYIGMGADIVVAHHPHVVQNYELLENGKAIFYSLGNFIFDTDYQRAQFNTDRGVLLKLALDASGFEFEALGMKLDRDCERLSAAPVPAVFANVDAASYEKLIPLSAKARVVSEKMRMTFLEPERFSAFGAGEWSDYLASDVHESYAKGEYMDFVLIGKLAGDAGKTVLSEDEKKIAEYIEKQL